jgi:HNH endonuclease
MARTRVMVEISPETGLPVRIFKYPGAALFHPPEVVREMPKKEAVASIRHQVFVRSAGRCEYGCGQEVTEHGYPRGEMHEEIPRSKGGEISLDNSKFVCPSCHRNDERGHANRRLHFGEKHV